MVHPLRQDKLPKTLEAVIPDPDEKSQNEAPVCLTEENFHEFFLRYSRPVLSFIFAMIQDRFHAEELCQETFIRAFRKLDSRTGNAAPSTWLFGIARNVIREAVKDKYRNLRQVPLDDPSARRLNAVVLSVDQQLISEELNHRIRYSLGKLTEDQRAVFILKLIHNLRYDEIARITGASLSKLKTDLHRARLEMRKNLHSYMCGESA
jgi:RNA polymerase sigma-70 factor, ECF subfamily